MAAQSADPLISTLIRTSHLRKLCSSSLVVEMKPLLGLGEEVGEVSSLFSTGRCSFHYAHAKAEVDHRQQSHLQNK